VNEESANETGQEMGTANDVQAACACVSNDNTRIAAHEEIETVNNVSGGTGNGDDEEVEEVEIAAQEESVTAKDDGKRTRDKGDEEIEIANNVGRGTKNEDDEEVESAIGCAEAVDEQEIATAEVQNLCLRQHWIRRRIL
jgi:hypothetical protein